MTRGEQGCNPHLQAMGLRKFPEQSFRQRLYTGLHTNQGTSSIEGVGLDTLATCIARLFPTRRHLVLLGFCIPQIWMYLVAQTVNGLPTAGMAVFHCASVAVFAGMAALYCWKPQLPVPGWATVVGGISMAALPVCLLAAPQSQSAILVASIAGAVGCSWCFLSWFRICCLTGARDCISYLLLSFALAALCRAITVVLPHAVVLCILAIASLGLLVLEPYALNLASEHGDDSRPRPTATAFSGRQNIIVLVELAIYSVALGITGPTGAESPSDTLAMVLNYTLRILLAMLLFAWLNFSKKRSSVANAAQTTFCVVAALILGVAFLGDQKSLTVITLISFTRGVVLMLLAIMAAEITFGRHLHPFVAFGIARVVYELADLCGNLLSPTLIHSDRLAITTLNVLFFIAGCLFLFAMNRTIKTVAHLESSDGPFGEPHIDEKLVGTERQAEIARLYGLTERESEVFLLLCQGRGKTYIAQALHISENTVRHHSKNIYNKLGVHNREDLLNLSNPS